MAGVVSLVVLGSRSNSSHSGAITLLASEPGYGALLDETAAANVAADVAAKTNLLITEEANEAASTLNAQVALPVADDFTLAKRQVTSTAGDATRSVSTYQVQNGDTLSQIAAKFNITTNTLKWANDLSDADSIKPGQSLTILPVSGLIHTVAAGETAETLAAKYQSNAAQILSFNNAEVDGLKPGVKIIIPDGVKQAAPAPVRPAIAGPARVAAVTPRFFGGIGNSYAYGYCTWYVASMRAVPQFWGNARSWYYNAQASGYATGRTPRPGAIAQTPVGYGGYGHVAIVEQVNGNQVLISEMNGIAGWGRVGRRWANASDFSYIY